MLTIPTDLYDETTRRGTAASVVAYRSRQRSETVPVLVAAPTLVHVRTGTKLLHAPDRREPVEVATGRVVLMPTGVRLMSEFLTAGGVYESTIVSFDPSFLARAVPELQGSRDGRLAPTCHVDPLPGIAERMVGFHDSRDDGRLLELRLEEVALRLSRGPLSVRRVLAHGVRVGHGDATVRLRFVMQQHFNEPLQLADFATLCGRSLASFKRDFRRTYGQAPGRWLAEQRLTYAAQLLADGERSVTEVCFACGFGNLSNFIRAFGRRFDVSPKQWQLRGA
jgi:AraC-like DNA-binding protein